MNIEYLIKLWELSNLDTILIKDLPLARGTEFEFIDSADMLEVKVIYRKGE